jgi:hypothetical protein
MTPLPAHRRLAFREHLTRQVARAMERGPLPLTAALADDVPLPAAVDATLGAACATCQGHCCRLGGVRAYLWPERMRRYLAEHPTQSPEEAVDAYMAYMQATTITDSCVFHGETGCTLPREMRSDTCNRFLCGALYELQRALPGDGSARAFVAAAEGREVRNAAFIDAGVRRTVDVAQ